MDAINTISPVDGKVYVNRTFMSLEKASDLIAKSVVAQRTWQAMSIAERAICCHKLVDYFAEHKAEIASEITWQMGRPIAQSPGEIDGFIERSRVMIDMADKSLQMIRLPTKDNFERYIRRLPWGVVLAIAPWNYPYLTSVNVIVPALMAGNAILLKPSPQTPKTGDRYAEAAHYAGLPEGLYQSLYLSNNDTEQVVQHPDIHYIAFTGSVSAGQKVQAAAAKVFKPVGLELGGKDPAYVCEDADIEETVANLVDGAFFNSGQSCCGIERIYVHQTVYKDFIKRYVAEVKRYRLGDPTDINTNLGPIVSVGAGHAIRAQINEALSRGAKTLIDEQDFPATSLGENYLAPQVLVDVDHSMSIMTEETFGPVVGIMPVNSDDEAIRLMNDSPFGLTASIWTQDEDKAVKIGNEVNTGTWFMNRCDYLDPALAWTGIKNSGRGVALSSLGYDQLTRPKSFHLRKKL